MRITQVGRGIVDPRMSLRLDSAWTTTATIQLILTQTSDANQEVPIPTGAQNIPGLVEIPCRLASIVKERPTGDLTRGGAVEEYHERRHCVLCGYYPQIRPDDMQAIIDGVVYPIRSVEHDGSQINTRIKLEVVRPNG